MARPRRGRASCSRCTYRAGRSTAPSNRRAIRWSVVAWGLSLQVLFAIFVLRVPFGQGLFRTLGEGVAAVLHYSYEGSKFVFGDIGSPTSSLGVIFAFQILPAIIF